MLTFVTLITDTDQFEQCRASLGDGASSELPWIEVRPNPLGWNAAQGLNHGIARARTPWVVCTHQDVLFPPGWLDLIRTQLDAQPADVAIVGIVGNLEGGEVR